ncbi:MULTISPECIES: IclR family transcriptional regulator domain-containing protein [unclassified Bradyrhizobium]
MDVKPIRALGRGLAVLAALNRHASASALTLARETGLPRATVYRSLKTLIDTGYVMQSRSDDRFTLLLKVRELSDGFEDEQWLGAAAAPVIFDLTRKILWPCDVTTLEGARMVVRESTHRFAPMSIDRRMVGVRIPLLASSAGLAYLAFTTARERALLLDLLETSGELTERAATEKQLQSVRRRGYAVRQGGRIWPHTGTIAMPIRRDRHVIGCASIIWMTKALTATEGIARCQAPLRDAIRAIEARLRAL